LGLFGSTEGRGGRKKEGEGRVGILIKNVWFARGGMDFKINLSFYP